MEQQKVNILVFGTTTTNRPSTSAIVGSVYKFLHGIFSFNVPENGTQTQSSTTMTTNISELAVFLPLVVSGSKQNFPSCYQCCGFSSVLRLDDRKGIRPVKTCWNYP